MQTEFKTIVKDNIATAAVLAATFVVVVGAIVDNVDGTAKTAVAIPLQQMEAIVVNEQRAEVSRLETILVTASRDARIEATSN